jgi:hypothetical protein
MLVFDTAPDGVPVLGDMELAVRVFQVVFVS